MTRELEKRNVRSSWSIGFVQPKEKVREGCYCCLLQPKKKVQRNGVRLLLEVQSDETRGYGHKLQLGKIRLNIRKSFFTVRVENTKAGCAERLWCIHPWRQWKPSWTWLWATCPHQTCPGQKVGLYELWRSLPTYTLLWFPDTLINIFPVLEASPKYFYVPDLYFCKNVKIFIVISAYGEILIVRIHPTRARLVAKWRQQNQRCKVP